MLVAVDIDGTVDADPPMFLSLMSSLQAAGHTVIVVTGSQGVSQDELETDAVEKVGYLKSIGLDACYSEMVVLQADDDGLPDEKARYLDERGCDLLIDNSKANAKAAADVCTVLVPWQSRQ